MDRKEFFRKTCLAGVCGCGFGALALNARDVAGADQESINPVPQQWLITLLENLDRNVDQAELRKIIKLSAGVHYDQLKMDDLLSGYAGKLREFIGFLEKEWGWKVNFDEAAGVITADENKSYCVCPVLKGTPAGSPAICYCSEGFAEKMFSKVAGVTVTAEVVSSVRRGDKSCIYRIQLPA
jgi:predicted hydrocarbon binding protein